MQVLVLGAGLQGAACAFDLLSTTDWSVTLADHHHVDPPKFLRSFGPRLRPEQLDAKDEQAVRRTMVGHHAVLSALPYYFNAAMARLAVDVGVHFADLGGNTEIVQEQKTLDQEARSQGVSVVPDCGLAPGMVNILAADGIARLDHTDSVKMFVGGLPQHPEPPLNYQIVYSLEGVLDYYTTRSWVLRNGVPTQVDALSERETVDFPEPIGKLEAFHTAGGISTMPWVYEGQIQKIEYKTLRYLGHASIMSAIRDLGLLDLEPLRVGELSVRPRDVFIATVEPALRKPDGRDLVALHVAVRGTRHGRPATMRYRLLDYYDEAREISSMMRVTGYSLSITGQLQVEGAIPPGVRSAYVTTPMQRYVDELRKRQIDVRIEEITR